jgi:integrase
MTVSAVREDYTAAAVYLARLKSKRSREGIASQLRLICIALGMDKEVAKKDAAPWMRINWATLNATTTELIIAKCREIPNRYGDKRSPSGIRLIRATLFGVAGALFDNRTITADELMRIHRTKPDKGERLPRGKDLDETIKATLMENAQQDETPRGYRNAAILAFAMATGWRLSEIAGAYLGDINLQAKTAVTIGKGDKQRETPLNDTCIEAIRDWLKIRGRDDGPLFCVVRKGGKIDQDHQMSATAMYQIIDKLGAKPHDLRRTFIGDAIEASDLSTAQKLAGHSKPDTTAGYDRRGKKIQRDTVNKINVPYKKRK